MSSCRCVAVVMTPRLSHRRSGGTLFAMSLRAASVNWETVTARTDWGRVSPTVSATRPRLLSTTACCDTARVEKGARQMQLLKVSRHAAGRHRCAPRKSSHVAKPQRTLQRFVGRKCQHWLRLVDAQVLQHLICQKSRHWIGTVAAERESLCLEL